MHGLQIPPSVSLRLSRSQPKMVSTINDTHIHTPMYLSRGSCKHKKTCFTNELVHLLAPFYFFCNHCFIVQKKPKTFTARMQNLDKNRAFLGENDRKKCVKQANGKGVRFPRGGCNLMAISDEF